MQRAQFLRTIQNYVARGSVGASTVRGQGAGVATAARGYLSELTLHQFSVTNATVFAERLEGATLALTAAIPRPSRSWGLSRKVVNIFLRNALYTSYLAEHYELRRAEPFFELPLDSVCTSYLRLESERGALPTWKGVKHLTREQSTVYQDCASFVAKRHRISRVHLDAYWWGGRPATNAT